MNTIQEDYIFGDAARINSNIVILPTYIQESSGKSIYTKESISLIKYLNAKDLNVSLLEPNSENVLYQDNKSIEWIAPIIFVSKAIIENQEVVKLLIDVIISYVSEKFAPALGCKSKCSFVYEDKKSKTAYTKVSYEGDISGLKDIENILRAINDE